MTEFTKLEQIRRHLCPPLETQKSEDGERRVQKNLSLLERDAERIKSLAARNRVSQAKLLSMALDALEKALISES